MVSAILVLMVASGLAIGVYVNMSNNSDDQLLNSLSKHILLPGDEEPAILTIVDKSKVSSVFLKPAKNGDKVVVYQKHKRAIIYRPSIDRIVDAGPVLIDDLEEK